MDNQKLSYRWEIIDFCRGLAAFSVMVFHARAISGIGGRQGLELLNNGDYVFGAFYIGLSPFSLGGYGVQLFFVISGYCIHYSFARSGIKHISISSWLTYYKRRLWRIYPTYTFSLLMAWLLAIFYFNNLSSSELSFNVAPSTFLGNMLALQGFLVPDLGGLEVIWTLSIELHLYLVYPLIFLIVRKWNVLILLKISLILSLFTICTIRYFNLEEVMTYWHAGGPFFTKYLFTWVCGVFLAEVHIGRAKMPMVHVTSVIFCIAITCLLVLMGFNDFVELPLALIITVLLYKLTHVYGNWLSKSDLFKAFRFIGSFSFSLYLIHLLIIYLCKSVLGGTLHPFYVFLVSLFLSLIFSWLLFITIEKPFLKYRDS
jgi:peptidoglycan/LPS O-acetylase OafA/YrhL